MSEPMPMMEADSAGSREWYDKMAAAPEGNEPAGAEPLPDGSGGESLGDLLSREPSDTVPAATGTYALFRATNGSLVLVLNDNVVGVKTLTVPKAMVSMLGNGSGRRRLFPFPSFGGK
jgi:hypothetical protein